MLTMSINWKSFFADRRGSVAATFGIAVIPIVGLIGAAVDYSRTATERNRLQAALDATALAIIHLPQNSTASQVSAAAQTFFSNVYVPPYGLRTPQVIAALNSNNSGTSVQLSVSEALPTSILGIIGTSSITVGASTNTINQQQSIEIALALDNTGSMAQNGKIDSLKTAVGNMLTALEGFSKTQGDVKVSVVPFNTQINIGTASPNATYLRYDVSVTNSSLSSYLQSKGISRSAPTPSNWNGCLSDRDQSYFDYDTSSDPAGSITNTKYVASFCHYYTTGYAQAGKQIVQMKPLTTDLESVRTTVNSMIPTGATNVTMGVAMGMSTLRNDTPFGANSSTSPFTKKFLVLLTDGANTQNRFVGSGYDGNPDQAAIDARMTLACNSAKARAVRVITIGVQDGQSVLLRNCASDSSSYYAVNDASQLNSVFQQILSQVTGIRVGS